VKTVKTTNFIFITFLSFTIYFLMMHSSASAQQSNFQIAPSPIAYPYFEDGRFDGRFDLTFINISMDNFNLTGGDMGGRVRSAFSDYLAIDGTFGAMFLGGSMKPGLAPISFYSSSWYTVPGDKASLSFLAMRGSINLELQPIHTSDFDVILFGGPQFMISNFAITSKYRMIRYSDGYVSPYEYEDKLTIVSTMSGVQAGIQLDINLGSDMRVSPFFMMTSSSGSATMTDDPQLEGYDPVSYDVDIPSTTSMSYGMDILFGDISIGTVLQQMKKTEETTQDTSIIMISVSFLFSDGAKNSTGETGTGTAADESKIE